MRDGGYADLRGARGLGAHSGHERLARGLGWFSLGLGLAQLLAPRTLCRALGMKNKETLVRAYGTREMMTGVAILMSHDPTPWIWGRVAGDALDLATLATGFSRDNPETGNLTLATAAVAGVTILDVICAQGLTSEKSLGGADHPTYRDRSGFPRSPSAMRGRASEFKVPADFRVPEPLRPWDSARA